MIQIRPPAVAGAFYPDDPDTLRSDIRGYLDQAESSGPPPKALIVPHAGYVYSGPTAGFAYKLWQNSGIERVIILGPAHRVPVMGLALPGAVAFETPLGDVRVHVASCSAIEEMPQIDLNVAAHTLEHSVEVQVPFLQSVLSDFYIVPLVVGMVEPQKVAEVLEALWDDAKTGIVISSDLSHYHTYDVARDIDHETCEQIVALDNTISHEQACGATAINGLLTIARARGMKVKLLDARNSGDTAGPKGQVVGYGAFACYE